MLEWTHLVVQYFHNEGLYKIIQGTPNEFKCIQVTWVFVDEPLIFFGRCNKYLNENFAHECPSLSIEKINTLNISQQFLKSFHNCRAFWSLNWPKINSFLVLNGTSPYLVKNWRTNFCQIAIQLLSNHHFSCKFKQFRSHFEHL